ncbi:serine/threonine protein kinase [Caloranaerobacter azorensis H53214]|uniref:Serine/threonine protein kinase n=1 Tax=Caloranaerobacter azorensis H53214 TaxID=1156417 RepID=A0A096CVC7_9FIRM|nr:AAA family ATPase [Caloranaerobacter azorensis]KGG80489.1 serine/threonine protein kinase [Caloranaerobacter azorensis H53214]
MTPICVKLFDIPTVIKDGKKITFPLRKAEALFYYLVVNKKATRDELAFLLWGDLPEKTAKKNLRNTMYKIRKSFEMDIIISPQKHIVMLNPDIDLNIDLDIFLSDSDNDIKAYSGEFLKGFLVKDAQKFDEWLINTRENFKEIYISKLYRRINESQLKREYDLVEKYAKLLIEADEFDEKAHRILMKLYSSKGVYNKAIDIYNKLLKRLASELGITPELETKRLYENILLMRDSKEKEDLSNKEFFYGRNEELQFLEKNYKEFVYGKSSKSVLIIGEAGIGKTRLKDKFLSMIDKEDVYIIEANCYQVEEDYLLKPWNTILNKLINIIKIENIDVPALWKNIISCIFPVFADESVQLNINPVEKIDSLKYQVVEDVILSIFRKVSRKKKILLIFEDLHWMDDMSLSLLSKLILHDENNNINLLGTLRNVCSYKIERFTALLIKYNKLEKIFLNRFTKSEVEDFLSKALPGHRFTEELKNRIYEETEGNTFFLVEFLNTVKEKGNINFMTSKIQDILKSRLLGISDDGRKIINIISLFFDEASLDIIKEVSGKSELEIIEIIEELKNKYIIKEIVQEDKISYKFTHQKLREFVYFEQSQTMRRLLHNRIGSILERNLKNNNSDMLLYPKIIYHFSNGGNKLATLKYSIKNVDRYLDFSHELFPELTNVPIKDKGYLYITKDKAIKYLNDIEKLLDEVKKKEGLTEDIVKLEIAFFHMKGRYLIREGEYDRGIDYIKRVINKSIEVGEYRYALKGYRQMIYYSIQTHNSDTMKKYLDLGLKLARQLEYKKDIAILLRLKGVNKIMSGEYKKAEEFLKESIRMFTILNQDEDRYSLNIAAAYNYIGEIRRHNMSFSTALTFYDKAIKICEDKKVIRGLTIFTTNAGQAAYDMGDYHRARQYLRKALDVYNHIDTLWGRSTAEGYMALLYIQEGKYKEALESLKRADYFSKKLKSPYELGLIYRVKAEIRSKMGKNQFLNDIFKDYLNKDLKYYCDCGIELLKKVRESYEVDILKALRKE